MHENLYIITPGALATLERAESLALAGAPPMAAAQPSRPRTTGSKVGVAQVPVVGILTPTPDRFAAWFGANTTYAQIMDDLKWAAEDPLVQRIELVVDSPGGSVDGLFEVVELIEAIRAGGKPLSVQARAAQSAAYIIAAAAGRITASSAAAPFGSVGVVFAMHVNPQLHTLTNTASPAKRPDPTTPEGRGIVREHLDAIHAMATRAIAKGRGRPEGGITEAFGAGRTFLAEQALSRGMIDAVDRQTVTVRHSQTALAADLVAQIQGRKGTAGGLLGVAAFAGGDMQGGDMQERIAARLCAGRSSEAAEMHVAPEAAPFPPSYSSGRDMQDLIAERLAGRADNEPDLTSRAASGAPGGDMQERIAARLCAGREGADSH